MLVSENSLINRVDGDFRAASSPTDAGGGTWDRIGGCTGSAATNDEIGSHLVTCTAYILQILKPTVSDITPLSGQH